MGFDPIKTCSITIDYHSLDKFGKLNFNIKEEHYSKLVRDLRKITVKNSYLPVSKFIYKEKPYYNLKLKTSAVPDTFNQSKLKGKKLKCNISFYEWEYMSKEGVRAVIDSYKVIGDADGVETSKVNKENRVYDPLEEDENEGDLDTLEKDLPIF
jgi:hypothetical protein